MTTNMIIMSRGTSEAFVRLVRKRGPQGTGKKHLDTQNWKQTAVDQ